MVRKLMYPLPAGMDLVALAERVLYVGSAEHKDYPSFAGRPAPRADASKCAPQFADRRDAVQEWLREAIRRGWIGGPIENGFPRYVWYRDQSAVYEARLINQGLGQYKGWELSRDEILPEFLQK